jgi:hypothetical protein
MRVFLMKLGGLKNKHPEFMDIHKYKENGYYEDLAKAYNAVPEESTVSVVEEIVVVSKKDRKIKSKVVNAETLETSGLETQEP